MRNTRIKYINNSIKVCEKYLESSFECNVVSLFYNLNGKPTNWLNNKKRGHQLLIRLKWDYIIKGYYFYMKVPL